MFNKIKHNLTAEKHLPKIVKQPGKPQFLTFRFYPIDRQGGRMSNWESDAKKHCNNEQRPAVHQPTNN